MTYNEIANNEFGMDYDQLGPSEQDWVHVEYEQQLNQFKADMLKAFDKQYWNK